ncbi:FHA domain-containing protein [Candidatus Latescibacterota bacterium]
MQEDWNIILSILESSDSSLIGQQKVFSTSPITLGRAETNDMVILDPAVSRNHAIIRVSDDYTRVFITDSSTYGTEVSGTKVPKGPGSGFTLTNGDTIKFGATVLRYEYKLKLTAQATFVGKMDRNFLDTPPSDSSEISPEKEEEIITDEKITVSEDTSKGLNPIYIGVIIVCILIIIYIAFFQ